MTMKDSRRLIRNLVAVIFVVALQTACMSFYSMAGPCSAGPGLIRPCQG